MPKDLRTFIDELARRAPNEIKRVVAECDPLLGITAVASKLEKMDQYPALYFENVKGSRLPLITNLTASYSRLAMALETTVDNMVNEYARRQANPIQPVEVETGPVHDIVLTGEDADLSVLPIPKHNELDAGRFISSGNLICRDPESGAYNVGLYRHQVYDSRTLGICINPGHHVAYVYQRHEAVGKPMEVAIAIGHHPAFVMGCISRLPGIGGEFAEAGALLGEPLELVRAKTVDLLVPARAEIVIEGYMPPGERRVEGPFGEWPGYYLSEVEQPVIHVTAITMRRDAIYYDIFSAHRDHLVIGSLPRMGSILHRVKQVVPGTKMVNVPAYSRMHCYISIHKTSDAEVKKAAFAALLTEPENLKLVIVVDDDIDVFRDSEVFWAVGTRFKADKGLLVIPDWSRFDLNPAGYEFGADGSSKLVNTAAMIIDATKPAPPVKYPPRAVVPDEIVDAVNLEELLHEYRPASATASLR